MRFVLGKLASTFKRDLKKDLATKAEYSACKDNKSRADFRTKWAHI
jgi:hypothetical protein